MLEAFAALEPGRSGRAELTRVAHERGWTGVRLDLPLALRFAPLLARVLKRVVLVWTVDADHCRVSLFEPSGGVVEATDRADQVAELVRVFRAAGIGEGAKPAAAVHTDEVDTGTTDAADSAAPAAAGDTDQPEAIGIGIGKTTPLDESQSDAAGVGGSPRLRHVAIAALLGVPDTVPGSAQVPGQAPAIGGERRFRRQQRIRGARDVLHLASGVGLIAAFLFVLRGPWVGIVVALGVVGVLQVVRFGLGRIRV